VSEDLSLLAADIYLEMGDKRMSGYLLSSGLSFHELKRRLLDAFLRYASFGELNEMSLLTPAVELWRSSSSISMTIISSRGA